MFQRLGAPTITPTNFTKACLLTLGLSLTGLLAGCSETNQSPPPPPPSNVGMAPAAAPAPAAGDGVAGPSSSNPALDSTRNPSMIPKSK